jgi:hypothetical protein
MWVTTTGVGQDLSWQPSCNRVSLVQILAYGKEP